MNFSYFLGWSAFRLLFTVYLPARAYHPERVPLDGPVILASNHASYLDPFLVGAMTRRPIHYLARKSLFRYPVVGRVLRSWNAVPVDRDSGSGAGLKTILDRLTAGGGIVLFPEGTRTADGTLQRARSGIGLTVIKSNAPVVPVRVFGTFEVFGRQHRFPRPGRVRVTFGPVMQFASLREESRLCSKPRLKQIYQDVADAILTEISRLAVGPDPRK